MVSAVSEFNFGKKKAEQLRQISSGLRSDALLSLGQKRDKKRMSDSLLEDSPGYKKQRKSKQKKKVVKEQQAEKREGGPSYGPGIAN